MRFFQKFLISLRQDDIELCYSNHFKQYEKTYTILTTLRKIKKLYLIFIILDKKLDSRYLKTVKIFELIYVESQKRYSSDICGIGLMDLENVLWDAAVYAARVFTRSIKGFPTKSSLSGHLLYSLRNPYGPMDKKLTADVCERLQLKSALTCKEN